MSTDGAMHPKPVTVTRVELIAVLGDMESRIEAGDSFEGNLTYAIPEDEDAPAGSFDVVAMYRVGNSQGQGGLRTLGDWSRENEGAAKTDVPPLPEGEYARVEIMGHDDHTGWVTEGDRAGVRVMVIRDWDGRTVAEVPGQSLYRFVPLATPLKRPEPQERAAITSGLRPVDEDEDDWDERNPF